MEKYICVDRGSLYGKSIDTYMLQDVTNSSNVITVNALELKRAIKENRVDVVNIVLTADNRLVVSNKKLNSEINANGLKDLTDKEIVTKINNNIASHLKVLLDKYSKYTVDLLSIKNFFETFKAFNLEYSVYCQGVAKFDVGYATKIYGAEQIDSDIYNVYFDIALNIKGLDYTYPGVHKQYRFNNAQLVFSNNVDKSCLCFKAKIKGKNIVFDNNFAFSNELIAVIHEFVANTVYASDIPMEPLDGTKEHIGGKLEILDTVNHNNYQMKLDTPTYRFLLECRKKISKACKARMEQSNPLKVTYF